MGLFDDFLTRKNVFDSLLEDTDDNILSNDDYDDMDADISVTDDDLEGIEDITDEDIENYTDDEDGPENDETHTPAEPNPEMDPETLPANALSADEEANVDRMMNAVGIPVIIQDELGTDDAMAEFIDNDGVIAESEGLLLEKTMVSVDKKKMRFNQLYKKSIVVIAREKNDPLYRKLEKIQSIELATKKALEKKYRAVALQRTKALIKRAMQSKSATISNAARKLK